MNVFQTSAFCSDFQSESVFFRRHANIRREQPGVSALFVGVAAGITAPFHDSVAPVPVSLRRPGEYITTRAGRQACKSVIIAISSYRALCTVERGD